MDMNENLFDAGSERQILANCMQDEKSILLCNDEGLSPKHFAIKINGIIYNAIMYLYTNNLSVDVISVCNIINHSGNTKKELEGIGGEEYVYLLGQSPKTLNISMFCQNVMNSYTKRKTIDVCEEIKTTLLTDKKVDSVQLINQKTLELTLENTKKNVNYKMGDLFEQRVVNAVKNPTLVPGLSVGWKRFDEMTGGACPNDLIIVVAESKTGKSVTLLNWAKHIAIDQKLPILWIDTEQTDAEEEMRLASIISQIPEIEIKTGLFNVDTQYGTAKEKQQRIVQTNELLRNSKFFHIFMPDLLRSRVA